MLLENGSTAIMLWAKNTEGSSATFKKSYTRGGRGKSVFPVAQIDDYVKHIFREHSQEADHWATWGVEGQRNYFVDKGNYSGKSKVVRGFWDGGVAIKGVETSGSRSSKLRYFWARARP